LDREKTKLRDSPGPENVCFLLYAISNCIGTGGKRRKISWGKGGGGNGKTKDTSKDLSIPLVVSGGVNLTVKRIVPKREGENQTSDRPKGEPWGGRGGSGENEIHPKATGGGVRRVWGGAVPNKEYYRMPRGGRKGRKNFNWGEETSFGVVRTIYVENE